MDLLNCSLCNGDLSFIGALGKMNHYRCEGCGMQFSKEKPSTACIELPELQIKVEQTAPDRFTVTYFRQVKRGLNYAQAAHEFGECVFHALACAGKLDSFYGE